MLNDSKFIQRFNQWNSIDKIYFCESFTESKFNVKYLNAPFLSNRMFVIKDLKTNRLKITIEYNTNAQRTKNSN